jgi:phosphomannomutase
VSEPIISVSGLRGIVGESLTPELLARYISAFCKVLPPGRVVVGRDGRLSGLALSQHVRARLATRGHEPIDAGIVATPTVGVLVRKLGAVGGVQISASHNPAPYNGVKLFNRDGRVIPAAEGRLVLEAFRRIDPQLEEDDILCDPGEPFDTTADHLRLVLATIRVPAVQDRGYRVLLDSNGGAGRDMGRKLLHALGCDLTLTGGDLHGQFLHPPEPTAENLAGVRQQVIDARADIGFCQDPDADRLAMIDENGRYIGEEYTLAICLDHVLRERPGPIVTNCATSRMAEDLAARYGVPFHRSAVGEANVVDKMLEVGAVFGGEGNGGPIDPRVGLVRDSFVGMALVLAAMASRDKKVSELADELPRYEIVKRSISLAADKLPAALDAVQRHLADAKPDRLDGLRLDWADRWLIIRGSNTEPIVRIIAEAPSASTAEALVKSAGDVITKLK